MPVFNSPVMVYECTDSSEAYELAGFLCNQNIPAYVIELDSSHELKPKPSSASTIKAQIFVEHHHQDVAKNLLSLEDLFANFLVRSDGRKFCFYCGEDVTEKDAGLCTNCGKDLTMGTDAEPLAEDQVEATWLVPTFVFITVSILIYKMLIAPD